MTTLTDLSQLTKSMVKKPVEEPKPAPKPKAKDAPVDREAAEVLAYFARPGGNAPQNIRQPKAAPKGSLRAVAHVASRADSAKDRVAELEAALEYPPGRRPAAKRAATRGANPATGELERRRAELKQILKDAGYFNDPKPLEKLGFKLISGRTHWKLQYANVRITMSKTPSDYRASLNTASDTANRCF